MGVLSQLFSGFSVSNAGPISADSFFNYVSLLLPGDGTNSAQNGTFLDSSVNNFTITRTGTAYQGTFTPFSQTGWAGRFNGTTDSISIPNNAAFNFGTGDFTVEWWQYFTGAWTSNNGVSIGQKLNDTTSGWVIYRNTTTNTQFYSVRVGGTIDYPSTVSPTPSKWQHWALVRSGATMTWYCDGQPAGSHNYASDISDASGLMYIGITQNWSSRYTGYISNLRIVKGTAVYTGAFTPPTSPLTAIEGTSLLMFQDNRFKDNSPNNFPITRNGAPSVQAASPFVPTSEYSTTNVGGSIYLESSSSQYLSAPASAQFDITGGNFTVEAWIYITSYNTMANSGSTIVTNFINSAGWSFSINGVNSVSGIEFRTYSGNATLDIKSASISNSQLPLNSWNHVAAVRSGNNIYFYVNGVQVGSTQPTPSATGAGGDLTVGIYRQNTTYSGNPKWFISNLRVVKGTAVYTTNFTPSVAPLTPIANTSLLLSATNGGIVDASSRNLLLLAGNAQVSTAKSKFGGASMLFDGTGDYITVPLNPNLTLGNGNFTVEFWVNMNNVTTLQQLLYLNGSSSGYPGLGVQVSTTGKIGCSASENGTSYRFDDTTGFGTAMLTNTWYHIAVVRVGALLNVYKDGQIISTYTFTSATASINSTITVNGIGAYNSSSRYLNGYIDDLRITPGVARYISNFTPPTAPYPNVTTEDPYFGSVALLLHGNGANNANNNTIVDSSANSFTVSKVGNPAQGTYSPFSPAGWSVQFPGGTGSYVSTATNITLGTGPYTVEWWFYPTQTPNGAQFLVSPTSLMILYNGTASWGRTNQGTWVGATLSTTLPDLFQWNHIAVVREGTGTNQEKIYLNGALVATGTNATNYAGTTFDIGKNMSVGNMSNLRITNTAVYTTSFTPPTAPLTAISGTQLLTLQSKRFVDNSGNNLTVTATGTPKIQPASPTVTESWSAASNGGSIYFNGSTDYLTIPDNAAFQFGLNDFTVECWYYPTRSSVNQCIAGKWNIFGGRAWNLWHTTGNNLAFGINGSTIINPATTLVLNTWNYIAATRNGSTFTLWLNGASIGTFTGTSTVNSSTAVNVVGTNLDGDTNNWPLAGYITNLRIVNGTALYTANFTPPTAPLTTVAGTALLLNGNNAGVIDNSPVSNNLLTFADTKISTTQSKFNGSSLYFDGVGDYATVSADSTMLQLSTDLFTIEGWFYSNSIAADAYFISKGNNLGGWSCGVLSTGAFRFLYTQTSINTPGSLITPNTWYHFAVVREGINANQFKIYINGQLQVTTTIADNFNQTELVTLGRSKAANAYWNGYVSDIRITKGIARYTGSFTPPTEPYPLK